MKKEVEISSRPTLKDLSLACAVYGSWWVEGTSTKYLVRVLRLTRGFLGFLIHECAHLSVAFILNMPIYSSVFKIYNKDYLMGYSWTMHMCPPQSVGTQIRASIVAAAPLLTLPLFIGLWGVYGLAFCVVFYEMFELSPVDVQNIKANYRNLKLAYQTRNM